MERPDRDQTAPAGHPILLIDGDCVLCNRVAQFVIRHDPAGKFRFAALQSPRADRLLRARGLAEPPAGTVVLLEGDAVYVRSDAALRMLGGLPFPWSLLRAGLNIPRPLRDLAYNAIARTRIRLFGRTSTCGLLSDAERACFLPDDDSPA